MREQVPELMHAALHRDAVPDAANRHLEPRHTVDDEELWPAQAASDETVEHRPPGFCAFSTNALDREQILAVRANADDYKQRDRRGFSIEPDTNVPSSINRTISSSASGHSRPPSRSSPSARPG